MRNKPPLIIAALISTLLLGLLYFQRASGAKSNISHQEIEGHGFSKEPDLVIVKPYDHQEAIKAIDGAWDSISMGDSYSKIGQFEQAASMYENAYSLDRGSRAVSGLLLATTYEKLRRYDDGIKLLDQMIRNRELSVNGVNNANIIKSRLFAAKSQAAQSAQSQ
jgi:tetratricopeptide (TPR) repeat protein